MKRFLAIAALVTGAGLVALAMNIAMFGAERPLPEGPERLEGDVLEGRNTASPAGEPFLYGRVRIRSAARDGKSLMHVDREFGSPVVRIATASGEETVRLPAPDDWRVARTHHDHATVESLSDLPHLEGVDLGRIGRAIPPPYEVEVRAVRVGDHVLAQREGTGTVSRVRVGDAEAFTSDSSGRDANRWPIVLLLLAVGVASCVAGVVTFRSARRP